MAATYTIKINGVRTHNLGSLTKVVKQIEFSVVGTEGTVSFELPQTLVVPDADATSFVPFEQLTEAQVVAWVNEHFEPIDAVKMHIQSVLDKQVAEAALAQQALPWAPPVEPAPETTV